MREGKLLVITGPTASGKTRLALEVALRLREQGQKLDWSDLLGQEFSKIRQVEIIYPEVGARHALPLLQNDNQNLILPGLTVAVLEVKAE